MKELPPMSESTRKRNPHLAPSALFPNPKALLSTLVVKPLTTEDLRDYSPDLTFKKTTDEDQLNKTERSFLAHLRRTLPQGAYIGIQNITLKLAHDCRLTPDFSYIDANGRFVFVDTKGTRGGKIHVEDDAQVKLKVAARTFRWARFVTAHWDGSEMVWKENEIKP